MSAPRPGALLGARYILLDALGTGSSATVFRARDRWREREVAVKVLRSGDGGPGGSARDTDERAELARREHALARDLSHPAIAGAIDAGRSGEHAYVVLELASGEPLDVALRAADPRAVAQVVDALASALAALHARGLVHGDLKPANVRVARRDDGLEARLLDLGSARPVGTSGGGTPAYAAPEAIGGVATFASDLFSLGVVAWEALTGALPFGRAGDPSYLTRLAAGGAPANEALVPGALAPILRRLLAPTPAARYASAGELRAALRTVIELPSSEETPATPVLVERDAVLTALRAHARSVAKEGAAPRYLAGAPRSGRSRVLAIAAAEARLEGLATIETTARGELGTWLRDLVAQAERLGGGDGTWAYAAIDDAGAGPDARHARLFARCACSSRSRRARRCSSSSTTRTTRRRACARRCASSRPRTASAASAG